jgi:hypothetical protein
VFSLIGHSKPEHGRLPLLFDVKNLEFARSCCTGTFDRIFWPLGPVVRDVRISDQRGRRVLQFVRSIVRLASSRGWLLPILLACHPAFGELSPTSEFDSPYQLRILNGGTVLEVSGSFSWALPQNFQAVLAASPQVRVVRLESPGGHIQPALEIATMIRQRGLDTYVGGFCASACTVAFLGGRQRWVAPNARLGFHQAHGPGLPPELANGFLREAYQRLAVPAAFIAHALRTPPTELWFPTHDELHVARLAADAPPAILATLDDGRPPALREVSHLAQVASGDAVVQFSTALFDLLGRLQDVNPEACWSFVHEGAADLGSLAPKPVLDAMTAAETRLAREARITAAAAPNGEEHKAAVADLIGTLRAGGQAAELAGLRAGSDHAAFCPSLRTLLRVALGLPESRGVRALRAVLSGG